jgi:hypothetical protein
MSAFSLFQRPCVVPYRNNEGSKAIIVQAIAKTIVVIYASMG